LSVQQGLERPEYHGRAGAGDDLYNATPAIRMSGGSGVET
jgi:hypothetical protein